MIFMLLFSAFGFAAGGTCDPAHAKELTVGTKGADLLAALADADCVCLGASKGTCSATTALEGASAARTGAAIQIRDQITLDRLVAGGLTLKGTKPDATLALKFEIGDALTYDGDQLSGTSQATDYYSFSSDAGWVAGRAPSPNAKEGLLVLADKTIHKFTVKKGDGDSDSSNSNDTSWCDDDEPGHGVQRICVDKSDGQQIKFIPEMDSYLAPNTRVELRVRVEPKQEVTAKMTGSRQLTAPSVEGYTAGGAGLTSGDGDKAKLKFEVHTFIFAPRKPGSSDLQITVGEKSTTVAEFEVATPIGGAIRVGVGVGTVADTAYQGILAPGSSTYEVVATTEGRFSPELIVGFAPFLEPQGRIYFDPRRQRFAPYVGLGVVAADNKDSETTLSLLRSVYLGGEFEFMHSSSLALAMQLRRVSRLPDAYEVGGPAPGEEVPTVSGYQLGVALIFNVSPEFLEFSRTPFRTKAK